MVSNETISSASNMYSFTDKANEKALIVRPMHEKDLENVIAIENVSFTTPWSIHSFTTELRDNEYARYFCLDLNKQVVGYMGLWFIIDEGHITNVAIAPKHRGKGWGELLMRSVMKEMHDLGMEKMTLEVRVSNIEAQKLYKKLGFEVAGIRKGYYLDTQEDAIIMWVDLL